MRKREEPDGYASDDRKVLAVLGVVCAVIGIFVLEGISKTFLR